MMEEEKPKKEELERGGGGKMKRKTAFVQRPPPYARPPQKAAGDGSSWWSSASRIFSFFSKSPPPPVGGSGDASNERDIQTTQSLEDGEITLGDGNTLERRFAVDEISDVEQGLEGKTNSGQVPMVTEVPKRQNSVSGNTISRPSVGNEISEIEERLEGRTLSRDEYNRLREILESRVAAQSSGDEYGNRMMELATQAEDVPSLNQNRLKGSDDKKEVVYLNRVRGESSNSFLNSSPGDLVGASPIDIAKAYMGTRTSELGVVSQSIISQGEATPISAKGFVSHSSVLSPRPKSSICWPGAMVQEGYSYLTPQTHTGSGAGIHTSQRTPYSRPVHSRSILKLKGDADRPCNILSTNMKQLQTPVYGGSQVALTSNSSLNDGVGSVGPVRRARRKFHGARTPSSLKGTSSSRPTTPFWDQGLDVSNNDLSMVKQSHEPGPSTNSSSRYQPVSVKMPSNLGPSSVHPQSVDMARKILEHLDRTIPTPEKKSAELKLATSWRTSSSSTLVEAPVSNPLLEISEKEARGTAQHTTPLGSSVLSKEISSALPLDKNVSTELNKSTDSKTNKEERQITAIPKKPPAHAFGNKPSLPSISISDPKSRVVNMRAAYNNNNGFGGFTFPVSAVGTLSEPPTPSVIPFSPIIAAAKPKEKSPPPSYSFGGRGEALIFLFPCSSSSSSNSSAAAPKFVFGSNKARLCFRPVVEDAVC